MLKKLQSSLFIGLLSAAALGLALPASAQEKAAPKAETKEKEKGGKRDTYPFTGKITSVDKVNKTILLNGAEGDRVFHITSMTKLTKAGKPATFDDAVVGEEAAGIAKKADGKVEAVSVRLGAKPEGTEKKEKKKKKEETK